MKAIGWVALAAAAFGFTHSAYAAECTTGSLSSYEGLGSAGCSVGGVTFSNISVSVNQGNATFGSITPVTFSNNGTEEFGLLLNFTQSATATSPADFGLSFNASGNLLDDTFTALDGSPGSQLSENLAGTDAAQIFVNGGGMQSESFTPVSSLLAVLDNFNGVSSESSAILTAFSLNSEPPVSATPLPGALPLFATGLVGFWGWTRRRKAQQAA